MQANELENIGAKDELLVNICLQLQAEVYISPPGSKVYLSQSNVFEDKGIRVHYQTFSHPEYGQQFGSFLPYMSVVDLLFNAGPDSLLLIRSGCGIE